MNGPSRVALVTGAGRGIGRALAIGLADAGFTIGLMGRNAADLHECAAHLAAGGVRTAVAVADVRRWAQVRRGVDQVEAAVGGIDLVVNNAGVIDPLEVPVWEADPAAWRAVIETDLLGPFHCVRAVVPGMLARGGGRVIDLNSGAGAADREVYSAYCAAKAGLFRINGNLHLAGYRRGMRAFEVSPGHVHTDMTASMPMHAERAEWTPLEEVVELVVAIADGRLDEWSGTFLRAGVDTPESLDATLRAAAESGRPLPATARRLVVAPYGEGDTLFR